MFNNGNASTNAMKDDSDFFSDEERYEWISCFHATEGNDFLVEIEKEFIKDSFNLAGLFKNVENYAESLRTILGDDDSDTGEFESEPYQESACLLYGLAHARYLLTAPGLEKMRAKFCAGEFGKCPRVLCREQHVLPAAVSDSAGAHGVKLFCAACRDLYEPPEKAHRRVDGAFFGTTFAHFFFLAYPELHPKPGAGAERYEPRVFGFKLHESSLQSSLQAKSEQMIAAKR